MSKRRKEKTVWIDDLCTDPVQDIVDFARLLKERPLTSETIVLPAIYADKLREIEQRWLQSQSNVL